MVAPIWSGQTVVCIASGPSLTQADCDYVRGRARVIAVNDGVQLAPWADVLYSSDRYWWPHYLASNAFDGPKYSVGSAPDRTDRFLKHPEISVLRHAGIDGLEMVDGLRTGRNSGYAALNLAVQMGASRVILLGYNMGPVGGQRHFFSGGISGDSPYQDFVKRFDTIAQPLRDLGVEVWNCTPESRLTVFPIVSLRDVLAEAA